MEFSIPSILLQYPVISALCALILGFAARTFYSVYLGPLSKFPGPKLAAATLWYEFYYDVVLRGRYTFKIKEMHEKYGTFMFLVLLLLIELGPIVRISPYELHIDEPDYYDELFSQHKSRSKYEFYLDQFQLPGSTFGTADHKLHRMRRAALNPFFSKQQINRLEPMLTYMIDKLCGRIDEFQKSGQPMEMRRVYMCLTTDVVTLYSLNKSWNHLDSPVFSPLWVETIKALTIAGITFKHLPWILPLTRLIPRELIRKLDPGMVMLLEWQDVSPVWTAKYEHADASLKKIQENTKAVIDGKFRSSLEHSDWGLDKTIFHALLESDLPTEEKSFPRLWQEAQVVIGAGADTTANALTITHFHILDNPDVQKRLREELITAWPDKSEPAQLKIIEQLPYLVFHSLLHCQIMFNAKSFFQNAVIQEGLRFSYGVTSRLQRIDETAIMKFQDFEIPAGVCSSLLSFHLSCK
jgi:cytochrome P450